MINIKGLCKLVFAATLLAQTSAYAADEYNVTTGGTVGGQPLGVHGVDTVALSTLNAIANGHATYTVVNDGVAYYFASKISAETFSADPAAYLPQFGGFCAFAVSIGAKLDGNPRFADIVEGKLYLFVNADVFAKYQENPKEVLQKAEKMWPGIQHVAVGDL